MNIQKVWVSVYNNHYKDWVSIFICVLLTLKRLRLVCKCLNQRKTFRLMSALTPKMFGLG